jgi:hypothetical protein
VRRLSIEDGYLHFTREDGSRCPVLCPYGQGAGILCCDSCAAFRVESRLERIDETTKGVDFVHCLAMVHNGRPEALGKIDG